MDKLVFPRLAYKVGGPWELEAGKFSVREVLSLEDMGDGWYLDQFEAKAAHDAVQAESALNAAKTHRAELEAKARALGIAFKPQWGDKKLAEAIAEASGA